MEDTKQSVDEKSFQTGSSEVRCAQEKSSGCVAVSSDFTADLTFIFVYCMQNQSDDDDDDDRNLPWRFLLSCLWVDEIHQTN